METLKIISMNCRGLQDVKKRKDVFKFLREKQFDIYCLQDTHFTEKDYTYVRSQWGYECYISPGRTDSRGVAVLFNNKIEYKVHSVQTDNVGNFILLRINIDNKFEITLVNIYGPNNDTPNFYSQLSAYLENYDTDFTIVCGDWNMIQDTNLDTYNYTDNVNNPRAREAMLDLKTKHNLVDPWRINNSNTRRYTWFRKTPTKKQD